MLVLRFAGSMMGEGAPRRTLSRRALVPLALVTVAGLVFDQYLHGRFL
ncbi:MAG TPA: hypothetical protein VHJ78_13370 [Actinomycetota bacterium]|nr:hypothetical protein [Actinomycetota bacterium]